MITRRNITSVEINPDFDEISHFFGFNEETVDSYEEDLLNLQELWLNQGFVLICQHGDHSCYGMVKDSNSTDGSSPYYIGIHHSRVVSDHYDPLLIVTFRDEIHQDVKHTAIVLHTLITHDEMFGTRKHKYDVNRMRQIRRRLSQRIAR